MFIKNKNFSINLPRKIKDDIHGSFSFSMQNAFFHLLKMKAVTRHKTLCAQAPGCQQHLTAPPSRAENLGNRDECNLSSRTFSFCHFAAEFAHYTAQCWFLRLFQGHRILYENDEVRGQKHKSPSCKEFNQEWAELGTERRKSCSWTSRLWGLFSISLSQQQSQGRGGSSNPQKWALTEGTPCPMGLNCWLKGLLAWEHCDLESLSGRELEHCRSWHCGSGYVSHGSH